MLQGKRKFGVIIVAILALVAVGGGAALATGAMDDNEQPITGEAYDKAVEAALAHTGEGHVTETEAGDEDSYYEVEVTLDDGSQVDVQLDENFKVVGANPDIEGDESDDDTD